MSQAGSAPATSVPSVPAGAGTTTTGAGAGTETVRRPEPGIARGVWEAPAWLFWVVAGIAVAAAVSYALMRLGVLKRRVKRRT